MGMLQLDINPPPEKLRQFGLIAPIMLLMIGLVLRWRFGLPLSGLTGLCVFGILIFAASRLSIRLVRPVYVGLVLIGFPIGWTISHLVMLLFYFGIITPLAIVFRLLGRDELNRRWDPQCESYWSEPAGHDDIKRYFRQF